jgi:hypothetical protein
VDLVSLYRPLHAVAGVDPKLGGKEGHDLPSFVFILSAYRSLPIRSERLEIGAKVLRMF